MKRTTTTWITLSLVALLLGACIPLSSPAPPPRDAATGGPADTESSAPETPQGQAANAAPAATAAPAVTAAARVPLKDAVVGMEPQAVWQNFYDLTQVPRPSHHEEKVRDFLVQFGKGLGLETIVDGAGNVLIRKPAAVGLEDREGVVLQAHMDMVAQPQDGTHDFLTEPIDAYVEGDWVAADGTTLGADDGIGVATAMAVLQSQTPPLGPIEALFTVNEEDGMDGALGLQPDLLQGTTLINLDWETEGTFLISSAGGEYARVKAPYAEENTPDGMQAYQVSVSGLTGGHSGTEINLGRGHATKLLVRLLSAAAPQYGVRLAEIAGGTAANAIPQSATALVTVPAAQAEAFLEYVGEFQGIVQAELAATEPNLAVGAAAAELPQQVVAEDAQRILLDALYGTPQGVVRMSDVVPGLVETSTNMGIVQGANGELDVTCYPRSSVDTELDDVAQMLSSVWDLGGIKVTFDGRFAGWKANPDSAILALMKSVYRDLYGVDPEVVSVHAGTECGVIQGAYPGMDAVSVGPTLLDVHTPNERLEIASVKKLADLLTETLVRIPAKS
jgi:dipeptidase D